MNGDTSTLRDGASLLKIRPSFSLFFARSAIYNGVAMIINKERLGGILLVSILLSLVTNAVAYRTAVYLVCPEPAVSLECFDLLRPGMGEEEARGLLEPPCILDHIGGPWRLARHREVPIRDADLEIVLIFDDGILTDGRATVNSQVVRRHLEPRDPILDPIRLALRRIEQP
jgi:hypothetical protein